MKLPRLRLLVALAALSFSAAPQAEDIDLYTGGEAATGAQSNVLIILDNSTNWAAASQHWDSGKQGEAELQALSEVLSTLTDSVNVGLMLAAGGNGGYVRFAIREMGSTNRTKFASMLDTMKANFGNDGDNDDKVNTASIVYDNMMNAAFRYFNGLARFGTTDQPSGSALDLRDYNGNNNSSTKQPAYPNNLGNYSLASSVATTYTPPASVSEGCAKNYIIFIGNGYPNQAGAASEITDAGALVGVTPNVSAISGGSARWADEWARFMYSYGVKSVVDDPDSVSAPKDKLWNKIATYTIDVCKDACESDQATLLKSMAKVGGGKYFKSTSLAEIKAALTLIFAEIQAVNSVFASATLPISVNTQGTYENQVYIGVFRPDAGSRPRWYGNLKEYKFGRYCDMDDADEALADKVRIDSTRSLVGGMVSATLTGTVSGTVAGTFTGSVTSAAGVVTAVSGTVSGTATGSSAITLAATISGASPGTTGSPGSNLGTGTVTGSIAGSGSGTGTATFTGTLNAAPSVSGTYTATDERVGDDVPAPDCNTYTNGTVSTKRPVKLYLGDQHGYRAIDEEGNTGFIDLSAKSYWTTDSSFWSFQPSDAGSTSDSPDGPLVERGGAAQRLRSKWAETATSPNPDGRKLYTCLATCFAGAAGSADRTLSNNVVYASNSEVTSALAAPSGSASVTLARSGNTVTATAAAGHSFAATDSVVIAGATPTDYNGTKTVVAVSGNTFTYAITEAPSTSVTGASVSATEATRTVSSIALSSTTAGATVTATVTPTVNFSAGTTQVTIANAAQSFLNGTKTGTVDGSGRFVFSVTLPSNPGATLTGSATVTCGTNAAETATSASWSSATGKFTFSKGSNYVGCKNFTGSVAVSGAADSAYNGTWTIAGTDKGTSSFLAGTQAAQTIVSPDGGAGITAVPAGSTTYTVDLARSLGGTTVTATVQSGNVHTITAGQAISISGSSDSTYNGNWTAATVANDNKSLTFTINAGSITPSTPATGTITATSAAASGTGPTTSNLIAWLRGKDVWEDENYSGTTTDVRASIHGDVLHSRPVVVNYGSTTGIVGFYGSNDGFLRAVKGGVGATDGEELWAFMPQEFMSYAKQARLYGNGTSSAYDGAGVIRYPNSACTVTPTPTARNYAWDGPVSAYQTEDGTSSTAPSKTWIFAGMRRGGRSVYAIDVTSPTAPKLLWRISNSHINGTASSDYAELGYTWSEPKVVKLKGTAADASTQSVVAVAFGAGHDPTVEDKPAGEARTPTMGRGVYVVNAETGAKISLLQGATLTAGSGLAGYYSIVADITPLDLNADGYVDRIYAADTGGNLWRFDAVQTAEIGSAGYWKKYLIAKLGDVGNDGGTDARKFMFAPEVLPFKSGGVSKVNVLVGSGDREKPLPNFKSDGTARSLSCGALYSDTYYPTSTSASKKVDDRFFAVIDAVQAGADEAATNADPILIADLQQVNNALNDTLTSFSLSGAYSGWNILLKNDPTSNLAAASQIPAEEKTVNQARVVGGVVYFATNSPAVMDKTTGVCSNLGEALGYAIDPFTGLPAFNRDGSTSNGTATYTQADYATRFAGGGLPPTVTAGVVTIGGTPYRFIIGSGGAYEESSSSISGQRNVLSLTGIRSRLYWSYGAD